MKQAPLQRKSPLVRHTPLARHSELPRFSPLRPQARAPRRAPLKPYHPKAHTVEEDAHLSAVVGLGCQACLHDGHPDTPTTVHHSRTRPDGQKYGAGLRASHFETMGLCEGHHQGQLDTSQLAFHRNPQAFEARYGTELEILALGYPRFVTANETLSHNTHKAVRARGGGAGLFGPAIHPRSPSW